METTCIPHCPKHGLLRTGPNDLPHDRIYCRCGRKAVWEPPVCPLSAERVHIQNERDYGMTLCGAWWAGNYIGNVPRGKVEEYRSRPDCRICPECEART